MKKILQLFLFATFLSTSLWAVTVSNFSTASETSDHGRVRITATTDTDGWYSVFWGTSSGTYPYVTNRYLTASPQVVITGGGCSVEPKGYVLLLTGSPGGISILGIDDPGRGCSGTPSVSIVDRNGSGSGAVATLNMSGGAATSFNISSAGSGYQFGMPCIGLTVCTENVGSGQIAFQLGGLSPSTTYHYVIQYCTAYNTANGSCTNTADQTFTTAADVTHPVMPNSLTNAWNPTPPDTSSGYTVVPMTVSGGAYVAASNVGPVIYGGTAPGPTTNWSVTAGDSLQTVINEVGYGAIIELPQSTTGAIPFASGTCGLLIDGKGIDPQATGGSIDAANHRYVIIQTHQINSSDFPPFGFRIDPNFHGIGLLANLQSAQACGAFGTTQSQIIRYQTTSGTVPTHHIWLQNVRLSQSTSVSGNVRYNAMITVGTASAGDVVNVTHPPDYIVMEHVYYHAPDYPATGDGFIKGSPKHFALLDSWADNMDCIACVQGVYFTTGGSGPITLKNNTIDARFQGVYIEKNQGENCYFVSGVPTGVGTPGSCPAYSNVQLLKNLFWWPLKTLGSSYAGWNGTGTPNYNPGPFDGVLRQWRNQVETKTCRLCQWIGNFINGQYSYQNEGSAFFASTSGGTDITGTNTTGSTDILIKSNYITHAANIVDCAGMTALANTADSQTAQNARITFQNNLAWDIGRTLYNQLNSQGGVVSTYVLQFPGCEDFNVLNNTLGFINADSGSSGFYWDPTMFIFGHGGPIQEGMAVQNNVMFLSQGQPSSQTGLTFDPFSDWGIPGGNSLCCAVNTPAPLPSGSTSAAVLASSVARTTATVNANALWGNNGGGSGNNVILCGSVGTGAEPWPDLDTSGCNTNKANMPGAGAYDTYPAGNTMAARISAAGYTAAPDVNNGSTVGSGDFTCNGTSPGCGSAGVNLTTLENDMGIVRGISATPSSTSASISLTAPDTNACSVDTSPDNTTWSRFTSAGGSTSQSISVTGLSASTTYHARLMCYYDQTGSWFSFPSEHANMITNFDFTTTGGGGGAGGSAISGKSVVSGSAVIH